MANVVIIFKASLENNTSMLFERTCEYLVLLNGFLITKTVSAISKRLCLPICAGNTELSRLSGS
ncbi:MAG: hypothetical protein COA42_04195 [Alteromonadaceae bacterium]|nr:MAG: hypothetical protein COA42_04195 [Alteromonadaceae bacterium]